MHVRYVYLSTPFTVGDFYISKLVMAKDYKLGMALILRDKNGISVLVLAECQTYYYGLAYA